ncbi:MAG: SCP2 sterol-binding domain-containing protein [Gammaproteobacteria bacterium]|nr:SCP2 sterol-binding domain-containing protein [Zetaproteobacteria bacterium]MCK5479672.1 SCP2 sterol-binding domain-containing protein [Gammaproteobacteria bacterium]
MKLPSAIISGFESAINRYLRLDPDAGARMAQLYGQCIALELRGLDLKLFILPGEQGIRLTDRFEGEANTVLRGTPLGMAQLGLGSNTGGTLFSGEVLIEGDVETGQAFKAILDEMDIDWEEQLSKLTGDFIAHQLGNASRHARNILRHSRTTIEQDISEYLQEELRVLPSRVETENFSTGVSRIGMDVERLEAHIKRLQDTLDSKPGQ